MIRHQTNAKTLYEENLKRNLSIRGSLLLRVGGKPCNQGGFLKEHLKGCASRHRRHTHTHTDRVCLEGGIGVWQQRRVPLRVLFVSVRELLP